MNHTESHNLNCLDQSIDHLVVSRQQMQLEIDLLRKKLARATQERALLADKNQQATQKIKRILAKLKDELS